MKTPNIFSYATSELSQDAFLCWLIACSESDEENLRNLGLGFIAFLYNAGQKKEDKIQLDQVCGLVKNEEYPYPRKQDYNIDVYFQAKIDGKIFSFIIEDKIWTQMHSDQLKKYVEKIKNSGVDENSIRKIYFKTGYIYEYEREKAEDKAGYDIIGLEDFVKFLCKHKNSVYNNIFKDYMDYITNQKDWLDGTLKRAKDFYGESSEYHETFRYHHVQWEFMNSLHNKSKGVFDEGNDSLWSPEIEQPTFKQGNNRGGDPWTQLWWYGIRGKYVGKGINEFIFWRIEGLYQLRLRHGVWPGKEIYDDFNKDRKKRLYLFRKIFQEEGEKVFKKSALPYPPGKNGRESTIGEIQFNSPENSVQEVFKKLPDFQSNLIRRILSEG